ncbi:unnamed protein product, partial [Vitis vinifera]
MLFSFLTFLYKRGKCPQKFVSLFSFFFIQVAVVGLGVDDNWCLVQEKEIVPVPFNDNSSLHFGTQRVQLLTEPSFSPSTFSHNF